MYFIFCLCSVCGNLFPFIVTFYDDGASKRKVITIEVKLNIVKRSEKGRNINEHWPVAWFKSFDCCLKHVHMCIHKNFLVRDKDISVLNYKLINSG